MRHREKAELRWRRERDKKGAEGENSTMSEIKNLQIAWIGGQKYRVFSQTEDRGKNAYEVDLSDGSCTCEHGEINAHEENTNSCKHIEKACAVAPSSPEADTQITMAHIELVQSALSIMEDARETVQAAESAKLDAEIARETVDDARQITTEAQAQQPIPPEEKREKLQNAFDAQAEGMNTLVHDDKIWVNKSPDAPDWTFDKWLSGPARMQYDPDNSPEQYYKNYIEPLDVDDYIAENL